jgi:ketosteroid isomerase-like protein
VKPAALALWMVFLAACASPRASFTDADRAAVAGVLAQQRDAWNRGDLAAFMDHYARGAELVFTSGGRVRRGWRETFDAYQRRYGHDRASMGALAFEVLQVTPLGADGAVVLGRWRLTETASPGSGVFSLVFERRGSVWRIVHDHTSSDPAPVTPP